MKPILLAILLSGCSVASYTRTDGVNTVSVWGAEFGNKQALEGFDYQSDTAKLSIGNRLVDNTEGLKAFIEGAVKGAVMGIKGGL